MPSTARQLRQPPTIEAIGRVPYFANVATITLNNWRDSLPLGVATYAKLINED